MRTRPYGWILSVLVGLGAGAAAWVWLAPTATPAATLVGLCLGLWLLEVVPPFVPTLALIAGAPIVHLPLGDLLASMADPVVVLFFGGFVIAQAAAAHGLDRRLVDLSIRLARGRAAALVGLVLAATAFLSMWISNVAAAALVLAALGPVLREGTWTRPLLVAIALGANVGGMSTPIGTGPNAIALASMSVPLTFLGWMKLALPITTGALVVSLVWILMVFRVRGPLKAPESAPPAADERPARVLGIATLAIVTWLSEPLHGIPSAAVSAGAAALLFATRLLPAAALMRIDWSTLFLIAGGIGLGRLVEHIGVTDAIAQALVTTPLTDGQVLAVLLVLTAVMSSLMSNTATATLLVPVAVGVLPGVPGVAILVALASSFGMPFIVSTPANAMAVGAGAKPSDLMWPGLLLMAGGCAVLALTGPFVLARHL